MAALDEFAGQLRALGHQVEIRGQFVTFGFTIPVGRRAHEVVSLGMEVPGDFPATPPPGPHVSPQIGHPAGAVHPSSLGAEWEYWSRPFPGWAATPRTVSDYLAHVRSLFTEL